MEQVKSQQASGKAARQQETDRIKALDNQLKAKMNDQKAAKAHIPFKSTEEIDVEIKRLEKSVESGKLKMVEERKALADVSSLNKQKKAFGILDERQHDIDKLKAQIAEIKKSSNSAEAKQMQQDFDRIKKELDDFHLAKRDAAKDSDAAYEKLQQSKAENDKAWQDLRQYKDAHFTAKRQYQDYEREAAKVRATRQKAEREAYLHGKKQEMLKVKLDEASTPAYSDEIRAAESIMRILDPSSVPPTVTSTISEFAAKASRVVDASGIKGTVLSKKTNDEEAYFIGSGGGGKKGKKGKRTNVTATNGASSPGPNKDSLSKLWAPGSIEQFSKIDVEPPSSADDLPATLEKVGEKRRFYLDDRDRKTKEVRIALLARTLRHADASTLTPCRMLTMLALSLRPWKARAVNLRKIR